ncbi:MAG: hypothetical protein ACD_24C00511G0006 [uncultured bacterium]|uniref:Ribulose-phosphate 3-epimerase n=1 Tax=candidate division WWE3 bacterium RBG_16_37_10 TaxID=1802610 RepID=A0A1F4V1M5_UNCKA|nr:MAG: hypothetical protein ACD_24C00511G0006 [uncultured bacterium]OGC51052.1 MAG: hypothetical protein A2W32_02295 [candidate division WWE3 bacterium RBG_16_37_10]
MKIIKQVIPAILEKHDGIAIKKAYAVQEFVKCIHLDIADSTFVNNITVLDPKILKKLPPNCIYEVHLMVDNPLNYVYSFLEEGVYMSYIHLEIPNIEKVLKKLELVKSKIGLVVDGQTSIEKIYPYINNFKHILVMGIKAGFSGQTFLESTVSKVRKLKELDQNVVISVDGGINEKTAKSVIKAGADNIVSASFIHNSTDVSKVIMELEELFNIQKQQL